MVVFFVHSKENGGTWTENLSKQKNERFPRDERRKILDFIEHRRITASQENMKIIEVGSHERR